MTVGSILELPFHRRPPLELLGIDADRETVDLEYTGFGWTEVEALWLEDAKGRRTLVERPLVIALHAADHGPELANDILLELDVPGQPVTVMLSAFLERWRPRLPPAEATVLAICNPHRARLARPPGVHYALGVVDSWLDTDADGDHLRLVAEAWRRTPPRGARRPMTQLVKHQPVVDDEAIQTYAGMYILKMMDLKPEDGGMVFPLVMPSELTPLDEVFTNLAVAGFVEQESRKDRWKLTKAGLAHLAGLIQEAEDLMDEFDDQELPEVIEELRARNLDVFRARFLWGWFDGELDDLVEFQRQRGVRPVQPLWAYYLTDDEFYAELAKDLESPALTA